MSIYPVIMCGGAGTRLWPASRPQKPKQFIALTSDRTLFQDTVLRVSGLATGGGRIIVVAGQDHERMIRTQLAELGVRAHLILEPKGRESAPAMSAAAEWTRRIDPEGINVFVSSDHYLPDAEAFQSAVGVACEAAAVGRIVTLGVKPTAPSTAYGYIHPSGEGLSDVVRFVEKPDVERAMEFIRQGFVWNTGIFVARASVLLEEVASFEPAIVSAVAEALPHDQGGNRVLLTQRFVDCPKISIDYAVMERTRRASVLKVDFDWSDLGAWDAVAASASQEDTPHVLIDAQGTLVRAPEGVVVSVLGVEQVAVVVESDAVLVCALSRSQDVKKVVERVREVAPASLDFSPSHGNLFEEGADFLSWMKLKALPVWATLGQRSDGIFVEALTFDGDPVDCNHRVRVQSRQMFVYARAAELGWQGPHQRVLESGLKAFGKYCCNDDGGLHGLLSPTLEVVTPNASFYDNAFGIFSMAHVAQMQTAHGTPEATAKRLLGLLKSQAEPNGAIIETDGYPFQSNAHMHLLEACLAWEKVSTDPVWRDMSDSVVKLATQYFIDPQGGFLREFFNADWQPAPGANGARIEPGHQFEWAWLIANYAQRRERADLEQVARKLYECGRKGLWKDAGVLADAITPQGAIAEYSARLWPQTEWLRAALLFATCSQGQEREIYMEDAETALAAVRGYLTADGLWRDQLIAPEVFSPEYAKASSLYHIMGACSQMVETFNMLGYPVSLGRLKN